MEVTYTFRFSDYDALSSACIPDRRRLIAIAAFWIGTLANLGFALWLVKEQTLQAALPNFLIFAALLLFWYFGITWLRRLNFRSLNLNGQTIRISLSQESVQSSQNGIESQMQWSAFTGHSLFKNHAFMWINKLQALVIPFDAFKSEAERERFLALVQSRIAPRTKG